MITRFRPSARLENRGSASGRREPSGHVGPQSVRTLPSSHGPIAALPGEPKTAVPIPVQTNPPGCPALRSFRILRHRRIAATTESAGSSATWARDPEDLPADYRAPETAPAGQCRLRGSGRAHGRKSLASAGRFSTASSWTAIRAWKSLARPRRTIRALAKPIGDCRRRKRHPAIRAISRTHRGARGRRETFPEPARIARMEAAQDITVGSRGHAKSLPEPAIDDREGSLAMTASPSAFEPEPGLPRRARVTPTRPAWTSSPKLAPGSADRHSDACRRVS